MPGSYDDVEALLNARDACRPVRREHHLPRHLYADPSNTFHITKCARHLSRPFSTPGLATEVAEAIRYRQRAGIWCIYAYCLMPDHLHLMVRLGPAATEPPAPLDLITIVDRYASFTTRIGWRYGIQGKLWQHDQFDRLMRTDREFATMCQYVLDNPVRKGWVEDWTEWPYSGILDEW